MNKRQRRKTARLARKFLAGELVYDQFATAAHECEQDDDLDEVETLIAHMPRCGGFGGVPEEQHKQYLKLIQAAIQRLEK